MEIDPNALTLVITAIRNILGGLRDAKEMLPEGKTKQEIEVKIAEADRIRIEAEVNLARSWGYPICRRTFPPVIMLKVDDDPETGDYRFRCPDCGDEHPPKLPPSLDWRSPLLDR